MTQIIKSIKTEKNDLDELKKLLQSRKETLIRLTEKLERLQLELIQLKSVYEHRFNRRYAALADIQRKILEIKKMVGLIAEGYSPEEAQKQVTEETQFGENFQYFDDEETIPERPQVPIEETEKYKDMWKELVMKFHPDLVQNAKQKKEYTDLMKRINKAYFEGNWHELLSIYEEHHGKEIDINTKDYYTDQLKQLETAIKNKNKELRDLRKSEWYIWKQSIARAKKKNRDLFAELETQLEDDILEKKQELEVLKDIYGYK